MTDPELIASVKAHGQLTPNLYHKGRILDGRRVAAVVISLGLRPQTRVIESRRRALRVLWERHPVRALRLAGISDPQRAAKYLGATVSQIEQTRRSRPQRYIRRVRRVEVLLDRVEEGLEELTVEAVRAAIAP